MNYSLKSKCQGCFALQSGKEFSCAMGIDITHEEDSGGQHIKPAPSHVKCYKPKSGKELREATELMKTKTTAQ